jgi:hypothetical protein
VRAAREPDVFAAVGALQEPLRRLAERAIVVEEELDLLLVLLRDEVELYGGGGRGVVGGGRGWGVVGGGVRKIARGNRSALSLT